LIMHYDSWDAAKAGWYNEPWLGTKREAIHGTYSAGEFGPGIFPNTGLKAQFNTHVVTYYDARAAGALRAVWSTTAMSPNVQTATTQFTEGSIIVKAAAFASEDANNLSNWWDAMSGAQLWKIYVPIGGVTPTPPPQVMPSYVAQFDIIVKDSQSSPKTGWVFMTLVYDKSAPGDIWDKMVPLGVQWGDDPEATRADMPLQENWINPKAPLYSTETLGWGDRLSGPNDGARNDIAVNGQVMKNAPRLRLHQLPQHLPVERYSTQDGHFPAAIILSSRPSRISNVWRQRPARSKRKQHLLPRPQLDRLDEMVPEQARHTTHGPRLGRHRF
jgi:hypothetical protein